MPCYDPTPTDREKAAWLVQQVLKEINGETPNYKPNGYDTGFGNPKELNENTRKVCEFLSKLQPKTIQDCYSLELQIWWRDHQKADKERK